VGSFNQSQILEQSTQNMVGTGLVKLAAEKGQKITLSNSLFHTGNQS
jgi:hypothetical protein